MNGIICFLIMLFVNDTDQKTCKLIQPPPLISRILMRQPAFSEFKYLK